MDERFVDKRNKCQSRVNQAIAGTSTSSPKVGVVIVKKVEMGRDEGEEEETSAAVRSPRSGQPAAGGGFKVSSTEEVYFAHQKQFPVLMNSSSLPLHLLH